MSFTRKALSLVAALSAVAFVIPAPLDAATFVQRCSGPSATKQSGRATVTPGINGLAEIQTARAIVHLYQCTPVAPTLGSGNLNISLTTPTPISCSAFATTQTYRASARITWRNSQVSVATLTITATGLKGLATITGRVRSGVFTGHAVRAQFHYVPVVSPAGQTVAWACANRVAPGGIRISIIGFTLFTTKALTIT